MKALRLFLVVTMTLGIGLTVKAEKKELKTVLYQVELHCATCQAKVEKNIPYEKGVKSLEVNLEAKTVKVSFREDKNTIEGIQKAIEKLGFKVTGNTVVDESSKAAADTKKKDGDK